MAIIRHSLKEFEKHIALSDENLEKLSLFGTPVELLDKEVEIEINPKVFFFINSTNILIIFLAIYILFRIYYDAGQFNEDEESDNSN